MVRKRKKSSRRRSRRMSEGASFMSSPGRKSRRRKGGRRRKRGFLSEGFSTSAMQNSGKAVLSGLVGGGIANILNRFEVPAWGRAVMNLGASFVAGTVLGMPNVGAGMAGAYGLLLSEQLTQGTLKENFDYADQNVLSDHPQFADAEGNPMFLAEDGNLYYLEEGEPQINPAYELSQGGIYANYINPSQY